MHIGLHSPFYLAPASILDSGSLWPPVDLLSYVSSLSLTGKYLTTLKMIGFCGQEKHELDILDTMMSPCSGYDIIKALLNEKKECYIPHKQQSSTA